MIWDMLERCPRTRYNYRYEVAQGAPRPSASLYTLFSFLFCEDLAKSIENTNSIEVTMVES